MNSSGFIPIYFSMVLGMLMVSNLLLSSLVHGVLLLSYINSIGGYSLLHLNKKRVLVAVYILCGVVYVSSLLYIFIASTRIVTFSSSLISYHLFICAAIIIATNIAKIGALLYGDKAISKAESSKRLIISTSLMIILELACASIIIASSHMFIKWSITGRLIVTFGISLFLILAMNARLLTLRPIMLAFTTNKPRGKPDRYNRMDDNAAIDDIRTQSFAEECDTKSGEKQTIKYIKTIESIINKGTYSKHKKDELEMDQLGHFGTKVKKPQRSRLVGKDAYCDDIGIVDEDISISED